MITDIRKTIFKGIGAIIFILIFIFSYYQYRYYINGPKIISINIENPMNVNKPSLEIQATLSNTKSITINDREIPIRDKKNIVDLVVFSPGNNIIDIELKDAFGNKKSYIYNIYYVCNNNEYQTLKERKETEKEEINKKEVIKQ